MSRYTVVWTAFAQSYLTKLWLASKDRQSIANAADDLERSLRQDPYRGSVRRTEQLLELVSVPLSVAFTISDDDRRVTIMGVKLVSP